MNRNIRSATFDDCEAMVEIYRPYVEESCTSFELETPSVDEFSRRVDQAQEAHEWIVLELKNDVIGYAYATAHRARAAYRHSVETSVYVHREHHGRGIGKSLYLELFGRLAERGYHNAFAGVTLPNPASVALHESLGFKAIGVFREIGFKQERWHDVGWWQRPVVDLGCL